MTTAPAPHTLGPRPVQLLPEDVPAIEAVPLSERGLPSSTYELVTRAAEAFGARPALKMLTEGGEWTEPLVLTYDGLLTQVNQAANLFTGLGLPAGGTVALMLPNTVASYTGLLGAQAVGVANPVNPMLAEKHLADILTLTQAEVLLAPAPELRPELWEKAVRLAARLPRLRALLSVGGPPADTGVDLNCVQGDFDALAAAEPEALLTTPASGDIAAYFHTGGTTGAPKVAPHTHANAVYMAWACGLTGAYLEDGATPLSGLPMFHANAVYVTGLSPFMHGGTVVSLSPDGYRDKRLMKDFWQILSHYRITTFSGVPTLYGSLPPVPEGVDLSSLKAGICGAAPLPKSVQTDFEASSGKPMMQGYGLTEATCATSSMPVFAPRPGSVGLRMAYQHVKAVRVDQDETPVGDCATGETGVLAVKGPSVFPGYLRDTDHGPVPDPAGKVFDGWLVTGDLGHVDEDGYVFLTGRAKDLIIRGGHNIDPRPVEESLLAHPAVTGAAVVGRPDAHSGEVPVAFVTTRTHISAKELVAWAAEHAVEPAAIPKWVHIIDELPVTEIGKVFKPALVEESLRRSALPEG